jgi:hypothetical protein
MLNVSGRSTSYGRVINDQFFVLNLRILFRYLTEAKEEHTISEPHYIRFVNGCYPLPTILTGVAKGISRDPLGRRPGNYFEAGHGVFDDLVL